MGKKFDELMDLIEDQFLKLNGELNLELSERECGIMASDAAEIAGKFYFSDYVTQENEITKLKKEIEKQGKTEDDK
jgi:hypothetical protein